MIQPSVSARSTRSAIGRPQMSRTSAMGSPLRTTSPGSTRWRTTQGTVTRGVPRRRQGYPGWTTLIPVMGSYSPSSIPAHLSTLVSPVTQAATMCGSGMCPVPSSMVIAGMRATLTAAPVVERCRLSSKYAEQPISFNTL